MRSEEASRKKWCLRWDLRNWESGRSTRKRLRQRQWLFQSLQEKARFFGKQSISESLKHRVRWNLGVVRNKRRGATVESEAETGILILGSWSVLSGAWQIILKVWREWYRQDLVSKQEDQPSRQERVMTSGPGSRLPAECFREQSWCSRMWKILVLYLQDQGRFVLTWITVSGYVWNAGRQVGGWADTC